MRDNTRLKLFPITMDILKDIFTKGQTVRAEIVEGIPRDSIIVRHSYNRDLHMYFLTIQNETFEPVKQGEQIPILNITVKALPPDEPKGWRDALESARTAVKLAEPTPGGLTEVAAKRIVTWIDELIGPDSKAPQKDAAPVKNRKKLAVIGGRGAAVNAVAAGLPSSADLDAVASEEAAKAATDQPYEFKEKPPAKSSSSVTTFASATDKGRSI